MDNDKVKVFDSDYNDEWYQRFFMCSACKCCFMTYLNNTMPHNYCPNCGKELIEGDDLNNG